MHVCKEECAPPDKDADFMAGKSGHLFTFKTDLTQKIYIAMHGSLFCDLSGSGDQIRGASLGRHAHAACHRQQLKNI